MLEPPACKVYHELLARLDNEALAALLTGWLRERAGELPATLARAARPVPAATVESRRDGNLRC